MAMLLARCHLAVLVLDMFTALCAGKCLPRGLLCPRGLPAPCAQPVWGEQANGDVCEVWCPAAAGVAVPAMGGVVRFTARPGCAHCVLVR